MHLVSYKESSNEKEFKIGALHEGKVADLHDLHQRMVREEATSDVSRETSAVLPVSPEAFFAKGIEAIEESKKALSFGLERNWKDNFKDSKEIVFGPPVATPSKIICVGTNYADHVAEMKGETPEYPVLFAKFANCLIGPDQQIEKRPVTEKLDYEAELVVVIGKEASQVKKEDALDYVGGYTIGNDISARDLQKRTPQWLQGKTLDNSTPIGPAVVTTDEVNDPSRLQIASYVNGEQRQSSSTEHLIFDVAHLIEFISGLITLKPGDLIFTGTPGGVGFAMDPPSFLKDGDEVVIEIDSLGKLGNKVKEIK